MPLKSHTMHRLLHLFSEDTHSNKGYTHYKKSYFQKRKLNPKAFRLFSHFSNKYTVLNNTTS
jgi:hypothetical protein